MLTRILVTAILLLVAVSCGSDLPTEPTASPRMSSPPPVIATDIAGDYQLTFTASPSCLLPRPLIKRTYRANVRAWVNHPQVAVDVSGATFFQDWAAGFTGTRDGDAIQFKIVGMAHPDDWYGSSLAELIDGTKWLAYDGTAVTTHRGNNITGTFDGQIALRNRDDPTRANLVECRATDHSIEFVR